MGDMRSEYKNLVEKRREKILGRLKYSGRIILK
jgi:hypothetical protein